MITTIDPTTTAERLAELVTTASRAGATHAHVLKAGGKRAGVVPLAELDATYRGVEATVTFGTKVEGLPFEPMPQPEHKEATFAPSDDSTGTSAAPAQPEASEEDTLAPDSPSPAPTSADKKPSTTRPAGTGFMAMIDKLLLDVDEHAGVVEGFPRSKHSAAEAHAVVSKAFPQKDPASVKKIIKVRPRHLEKQKGDLGFDETKNRAPRWRFVGPGKTYDSPERLVTEMVKAKKKDAEIFARIGQLFPGCTKVDTAFLASARTALSRTEQVKLPAAQVRKAKEEAKARIEKGKTSDVVARRLDNGINKVIKG